MPLAPPMGLAGFTLLAIAAAFATASAGWNPDGNPICTAAGTQQFHTGIPDGTGGVYVAWLDARGGNNVYAQHLLANGTIAPGWPVNGLAITTSGASGLPYVGSDGAGGLLLVYWLGGIRAQRINADGTVASGFPAEGKPIPMPGYILNAFNGVVTDGAGGAYIMTSWFDPPPNDFAQILYLTRITADGEFASGWAGRGLRLAGDGMNDIPSAAWLSATPEGDALCAWTDLVLAQVHYTYGVATRVHGNATFGAFDTFGGANQSLGPFDVNDDGQGGILATWKDASAFFGARWNSSGALQWPSPTTLPLVLHPVPDGTGAAYLVGKPGGQNAFVVHRRTGNGAIAPGWTAAGIPLSAPVATQAAYSRAVSSGLLTCWSENTSGAGLDVRAVVITSSGAVASGWAPGGTAVCMAPGDQQNPIVIPDGTGGGIAVWQDLRDNATTGQDLYAAKLQPDGVVAAQAALASASAEPGVIRLHWYSPDGASFHATLERAAGSTEFAPIAQVYADGSGNVRYEDHDVAAGVTYRYRLVVEDEAGRRALGEVALRVPDGLTLSLEPTRPNPSSGPFTLAFVLPTAEAARIELLDLSGRRVHAWSIAAARAGLQLLPIHEDLAPGVYVARLTQGGRSVATRLVRTP